MLQKTGFLYLAACGVVAISATIYLTYTVTTSIAVAQCSVPAAVQDDAATKRFLEGAPVPMEGGKRY